MKAPSLGLICCNTSRSMTPKGFQGSGPSASARAPSSVLLVSCPSLPLFCLQAAVSPLWPQPANLHIQYILYNICGHLISPPGSTEAISSSSTLLSTISDREACKYSSACSVRTDVCSRCPNALSMKGQGKAIRIACLDPGTQNQKFPFAPVHYPTQSRKFSGTQ